MPTEPKPDRGRFALRIMNNGGNPLEKLITLGLVVGVILAIVGVHHPDPSPLCLLYLNRFP